MVSAIADAGPSSVGAEALADVALAIVVAGVALEVAAASGGVTVAAQSFLLGGRTSLRGPRFHLSSWEGSISFATMLLLFEESPSSGMHSLHSVKRVVLLASASHSSGNGSMSHFGLLVQKTMILSRRSFWRFSLDVASC